MKSKKQECVFLLLSIILNALLFPDHVQLHALEFYQLTNAVQANNIYVSTTKNKRQRDGRFKTVEVYDEFACLQQCLRVPSECIAVNFRKTSTNNLHTCELLSFEGKLWDSPAFDDDDDFDFIVVQNPQYRDCYEIHKHLQLTESGVHRIRPRYSQSFLVFCDLKKPGGWTLIQRRKDGQINFEENWMNYKRGFGDVRGNHWLGLDNIHAMTSHGDYSLKIGLEDFDGITRAVHYGVFRVASEEDKYRLTVGQYTGSIGDSLSYHNNALFSTNDADNDDSPNSCAQECHGGWWYKQCQETNPNGLYLNGLNNRTNVGITWQAWHGQNYSLKRIRFKIRPNNIV